MTTPPEPAPAPAVRRRVLVIEPRDLITLFLLLVAVGLIVAAVAHLAGAWWAVLAGGLFALAAGLMNDRASTAPAADEPEG